MERAVVWACTDKKLRGGWKTERIREKGQSIDGERNIRDRERRRVTGPRQRDGERKNLVMGSRPEGQGKTGGRTAGYRKQVRDREPESGILQKRAGWGSGRWRREATRATEKMGTESGTEK